MKEELFIKMNSETWRELESLYTLINKKGIKSMSSNEIKRFLHLFRKSSHDMAFAKTHYPKSNVFQYLNSLIGKCHSNVYAVKKISPRILINYISREFPKLLKDYKFFILTSFSFFAIGLILSLAAVIYNPDNAIIFLPPELINSAKGHVTEGKASNWNYPLMSSYIMTNNISVSLKAFALGITLGLGTIYILFYNGATLGSLTGIIYMYGNPLNYWSLILPHGIIELTAIFISGASGLIIAKSILLPGEYSRKHSLIDGGKRAVSLIIGVVFMLIIAGIIEGFFTPLNISPFIKLCFAAITAIILALYFSIPYIIKK